MDLGQIHVAILGQLQAEFLVILRGLVEQLDGLGHLSLAQCLSQLHSLNGCAFRCSLRRNRLAFALALSCLGDAGGFALLGSHGGLGQTQRLLGLGIRLLGVGHGYHHVGLSHPGSGLHGRGTLGFLLHGVVAFLTRLGLGISSDLYFLSCVLSRFLCGERGHAHLDLPGFGAFLPHRLLSFGSNNFLFLISLGASLGLNIQYTLGTVSAHIRLNIQALLMLGGDLLLLGLQAGSTLGYGKRLLDDHRFLFLPGQPDATGTIHLCLFAGLDFLLFQAQQILILRVGGTHHHAIALHFTLLNILISLNACGLGKLPVIFNYHNRRSTFLGLGLINLTGTPGKILLVLPIQIPLVHFVPGILVFNYQFSLFILIIEQLIFFPQTLVGDLLLSGGDISDLLDALGIENVIFVQRFKRSHLEIINRHILQCVAIQILADYMDDFIPEFQTIGVKLCKLHLLTGCL